MVDASVWRGYILEEVIPYLIRNAGYDLIHDTVDEEHLEAGGRGLRVRGRGSRHQIDVLGELRWVPAFTYPFRLGIEAKFRSDTTGVGVVREAIANLKDINESQKAGKDFQYVYSIFSTQGFSDDAYELAAAHHIPLVDLGGERFSDLRRDIRRLARDFSGTPHLPGSGKIDFVRRLLRDALGTADVDLGEHPRESLLHDVGGSLERVVNRSQDYGEMFIGVPQHPSILILESGDPHSFVEYCRENGSHSVSITWEYNVHDLAEDNGNRGRWEIRPVGDGAAYNLEFRLPRKLFERAFQPIESRDDIGQIIRDTLALKQKELSRITVYHFSDENEDEVWRLFFDLEESLERAQRRRMGL